MDRNTLQAKVESGYTIRQLAEHFGCSSGSVRHWLKKHDLKTKRGPRGKHTAETPITYGCKCGETDPAKFYGRKSSICGKCQNRYNHDRGRERRHQGVVYKGGKCVRCGYEKCESALEFHHANPNEKDQDFRSMRGWSWDRLQKELDKCILVCKNCHAELHEEWRQQSVA